MKPIFKLPSKKQVDPTLLVEFFNAFVLKLNEQTLRPIVVTLAKWASKSDELDQTKQLILMQVFNGALATLKEFFVPYLSIYFDSTILASFEFATKGLYVGKGGKRSHEALTSTILPEFLPEICAITTANFKYDSGSVLTVENFERLVEPICGLVDLPLSKDF
jgi:hypothetical protein